MSAIIQLSVISDRGSIVKTSVAADHILLHFKDPKQRHGSVLQLTTGKTLRVKESAWVLNFLRWKAGRRSHGIVIYNYKTDQPEYQAWLDAQFNSDVPPWVETWKSDPDIVVFGDQPTEDDLEAARGRDGKRSTGRDIPTEQAEDDARLLHSMWIRSQLRFGIQLTWYEDNLGDLHLIPRKDDAGKPIPLTPGEKEALLAELGVE